MMDTILDPAILRCIPDQPQSRASVDDQMVALLVLASKFGLTLAADRLRSIIYGAP